jgi:regulator of cell morphogenesis and NO signaling
MDELKKDGKQTVSAIVRADYRTADVFRKHGINYCCSGEVSLQEACALRNIDYVKVEEELAEVTRSIRLPNSLQFSSWKIDFLADYITNVHHAYLYNSLPGLEMKLEKFINGHRNKYPALLELQETFIELARVLIPHCRQEDETVFPYIKQIDAAYRRNEPYGNLFVRTLRKPLSCVSGIHDEISELLQELKILANQFNYPDQACTNHQVIYHLLREFHDDLIQHMHLENNILYPEARKIEEELLNN